MRLSLKSKPKKARVKTEPQPASLVSPYRVKMHSKTPSQFPTDLLTLDQKVSEGQTQLEQMKKGSRLFGLIEEEKKKKVGENLPLSLVFQMIGCYTDLQKMQEEAKLHQDQDIRNKDWKEAEVATEVQIKFQNGFLFSPEIDKPRERSSEAKRRG